MLLPLIIPPTERISKDEVIVHSYIPLIEHLYFIIYNLNLQDINVFSFHLQEDLFINDNEKDVIYQYIFGKDETIVHNDGEGTRIMFRQYGDNEIYLECRTNEGNKLVIIEK